MKKFLKWIFIAFVGLIALGMIIQATKSPEQKAAEAAEREKMAAERADKKKEEAARVEAAKAANPQAEAVKQDGAEAGAKKEDAVVDSLTGPQKNASRSAEQYLSMAGFSRNGLIHQLSADAGEGYSVADATVAVDSLSVNWDEQAARSAQQYLSMQGFSCKGLIEQLSSSAGEKYTVSQATHGARQAGACN